MSKGEVWRDVVGYEGLYKVSDRGNVFSVERLNSRGHKCGGRILKPIYNRGGYLTFDLCKNGKVKTKSTHRLVAEAFIPNPNGLPQVNHIDEVKVNNNVENLEWCDTSHNINHGERNKKVSQKLSKKVIGVNIKTSEIITFRSTVEARSKGYFAVSQACRGAYYGGNLYKGYRWSYEEEGE